jgi:hypothetical protein
MARGRTCHQHENLTRAPVRWQGDYLEEDPQAHGTAWAEQVPAHTQAWPGYAHGAHPQPHAYPGYRPSNETWVGNICVEKYAAVHGMTVDHARAWLEKCAQESPGWFAPDAGAGRASSSHSHGAAHAASELQAAGEHNDTKEQRNKSADGTPARLTSTDRDVSAAAAASHAAEDDDLAALMQEAQQGDEQSDTAEQAASGQNE